MCKCTRFVFFSILTRVHKFFFIFHTGFSLVGFTRHVHVLVCFPMSVYLLMPLQTNMWDPPLPFTPLRATGQVDRRGLFVCLHSPCRRSIVTRNRPEIRQYETIFVCPLNVKAQVFIVKAHRPYNDIIYRFLLYCIDINNYT